MTATALEQSPALRFLQRILPAEGYKCATVLDDKRVFNKFFPTIAELEKFILAQDALGRTVYHACAAFGTPDSRKASNAIGAKCFWLDVDAGDGKPYPSAVEAAQATAAFCKATGLPKPIYVGSGNGLHLYWPLREKLEHREWMRYATGLRNAAQANGFQVDAVRTCDLASVLRTPGTHNRKLGEYRLVRCGELEGPYDLSEFDCFLEGGSDAKTNGTGSIRMHLRSWHKRDGTSSNVPSVISAAANIYADEPNYATGIIGSCQQVGALVAAPGKTSEPLWHAALGLMAFCVDGTDAAHNWSQPEWYNQIDEKIERQKEFGPTTCSKFASLNPKGCEGCPHAGKITSPIQLGRIQTRNGGDGSARNAKGLQSLPEDQRALESLPKLPEYVGRSETQKSPSNDSQADEEKALPLLPEGYFWHARKLVIKKEDNKGSPGFETITSYPVYLDAVQTGEVHDHHSLSMKLELPNEPVKTIIMPAKVFFSASGMSEMAGAGVMVHNAELFKQYVRDSVDKWNGERKLERRYDQFGWKDDETGFLYGTNLYAADSIKTVIGSDEVQSRSQYLGPRRNGSISGWSNAANQLFALGHEVQAFALLSSFAAPLMRFHSTGEGGAIVSLVSDKSGTGKTTALEAAASVWGRLKGTQIIDDDTTVAKGLKLAVFGNIACTYDELYNRDPEVIRRFVLMFTNGRDKDRGTADGTLRHVRAEWQTILLLASNNSIVDILSSMDGTDAPAYRVLEFIMDTPATMDKRRGDALKQQLDNNSGYAADVYLRTLLQPSTLNYIKAALPKWTDQIWNKTGLDKEHRFWVRTIASVIAAGTLVKAAGLLDFSVDRISGWAIEQVQNKHRSHGELSGHRSPISMLVSFLDQHLLDTIVVPKAFKPGPNQASHVLLEPRRSLLIRHELIENRIYVEEQTLKKWLVKNGVNTEGFYRELKEKGILGNVRRITLGAGTPHSTGQTTAIEFDAGHPAMSGYLKAVETIVTPASRRA